MLDENQGLLMVMLFKVVDYGELLCLTSLSDAILKFAILKCLGGVFSHPAGSGCLNFLIPPPPNLYGRFFRSSKVLLPCWHCLANACFHLPGKCVRT